MSDKKTLDNLCALRERIQADGAWNDDHMALMYDTAKTLGYDDLDAAFIAGDWPELYRQVTLLRNGDKTPPVVPTVPVEVREAWVAVYTYCPQYVLKKAELVNKWIESLMSQDGTP